MKVGPFRIRTGVIDHEKTSIAWVNELQRSTIMTSRAASCSFYVPIMTPIVVALTQDRIETEGQEEVNASANLNKRILVTIIAGSVEYNEIIRRNESTFRLYGSNISTTGFMGSEFSLVACEEIVEITISDLATEKLLASFEYKHLLSDSLPQGMDVNAIDFDGSSMPFITMPADGNNTTEAPPSLNTSPLVNVSQAVEEEELVDWDGDVVVEDVSVNTTPKKAATGERTLVLLPPSTPKQSTSQSASTSPDIDRPRGLFAHSFQSRFKPIIRRPEPKLKIKTETPGEEGQARSSSNGKTVSPPHVIRKDTLARVDEIESQIKVRRIKKKIREIHGHDFTNLVQ